MKCPACQQLNDPWIETHGDGSIRAMKYERRCMRPRCKKPLALVYQSITARFSWIVREPKPKEPKPDKE